MANVLVIGSGGREHALSWKLSQSPKVSKVFVAPGNAGTMKDNHSKCENAYVNVKDFKETAKFCKENQVQLVVVGPEDPLAAGIVDVLQAEGISCFGPTAAAAQIEASKRFAKDFMTRHNIPTAEYKSFTNVEEACSFIDQSSIKQFVVKTSGLAAGKGVIVTETREEAKKAVIDILQNKKFGDAGQEIVIEEKLIGEEVSCLAFTDGETIAMMPPSQDHKTLMEGDTGPNTGGMGVIAPYPNISLQDKDFIKNCIVGKAVAGFKKEGVIYRGVLYAGLMLTRTGPKVLEFNCRFGDPETQAIMMLLQSDLYDVCLSCVQGTLQHHFPLFDYDSFVVGVVVVSGGYPEAYRKGLPVSGLDKVASHNRTIFHAGTAIKDSQLVTSGGRVLAVMATASSVKDACLVASEGAALVQFDGAFFRRDIGFKVFSSSQGLTYKDAGVDIEAGNKLVENIKPIAKATARAGCSADLGGFGALFDMKATGYQDPILVSGTDGVGTKLKVAQKTGIHNTIGIDLVAMCVNDILAQGAEPLFFLDYFSTGNLSVSIATEVITGIAEGCRQAGCALIGGETAEMPSLYQGSDYDLAGFAVGAVERDRVLPNLSSIQEGDILIGLKSSGVHSNGFSLVRKVMEKWHIQWDQPSPYSRDKTIGEDLLEPTKIYVQSLLPLIKEGKIKAFAHITGGGLLENIPRVLPEGLCAVIDSFLWSIPPVFGWIAFKGNVPTNEMCRTFNCGIGGVLVVDKALEGDLMSRLSGEASVIGQLHKVQDDSSPRVVVKNLKQSLQKSCPSAYQMVRKKRVGVLISGTGTNLQALIDHTNSKENESCAEIVVVISNKAGVAGLERAKNHNIPTKVIDHRQFKSREEFDAVIHQHLKDADVDIVCLAGFMRILSGWFVKQWKGRMLNIHPSLLPSFKGSNAQKQAVDANVRISGCTVHFVEEEVDAGAIIVQESVPVYPGDTVDTLTNRIKKVEHKAFPRALEIVASEQVVLNSEGLVEWKY